MLGYIGHDPLAMNDTARCIPNEASLVTNPTDAAVSGYDPIFVFDLLARACRSFGYVENPFAILFMNDAKPDVPVRQPFVIPM